MGIHMEKWAKVGYEVRRWGLAAWKVVGRRWHFCPSRGSFPCQLSLPELQAQPLVSPEAAPLAMLKQFAFFSFQGMQFFCVL